MKTLVAALLVGAISAGPAATHADVPTAADTASCNQEARIRARTASPIARDQAGADAIRQGDPSPRGPAPNRPDPALIDPQVEGMDTGGARDAGYRAAYRVCMRRNGF